MKKKNGFTLAELLGIIIVVAIITLIAIPTVNKVIETSKVKSYKLSVLATSNEIEKECEMSLIRNETIIEKYDLTQTGINPKINIDNEQSNGEGTILVDTDCKTKIMLYTDKYCAIKDFTDDNISVTDIKEGNCELFPSAVFAASNLTFAGNSHVDTGNFSPILKISLLTFCCIP